MDSHIGFLFLEHTVLSSIISEISKDNLFEQNELIILDTEGKIIRKDSFKENLGLVGIDVNELQNGIYTILVSQGDKVSWGKFIKL